MGACLLVRPVRREHVPVPPRHGEVLERGLAHGRTQSAAHRGGGHGGVVRPVARPVARVEGPDVVRPRHVPKRDAGLDVADTEPRGGLPPWCVRCVVCGACGMCGVRSTQKGTRKQHAKDLRKKYTQKAQPELRHGGKMNRRVSHAANLRHVDDERIRRDAMSLHIFITR